MAERMKLRVLPVVKAYPEPSEKYGATVCVVGVTVPEGRWVRLYPIRFMELPKDKRFKKYQIIEAVVAKSHNDPRPETYQINEETIQVVGQPIGTGGNWSERKRLLADASVVSLCELQRLQKVERASLGMVRVREVTRFRTVEADEDKYTKAEKKYEYAATADLFNESKLKVEPLPFKYQYWFRCMEDACNGHRCSIIDWEAYELHRKMVSRWGKKKRLIKSSRNTLTTYADPTKRHVSSWGTCCDTPTLSSFLVRSILS